MSEQNRQSIREYLQNEKVQLSIQQSVQDARSRATVTISRAASLFNFSESQLREWEKRGLLKTERPLSSQDGKNTTGHRQYTPTELDKLALIRALINGGFAPGDIPENIDTIWEQILSEQQSQVLPVKGQSTDNMFNIVHIPVDRRPEHADQEVFWRYFVSQALRLSLILLCEDTPDTIAGLILPLQKLHVAEIVRSPYELPEAGSSLVGWLGRNGSFYTFLDPSPSFEFPSDFRIESLKVEEGELPRDGIVLENTLIVVQRKNPPLPLTSTLVGVIRRLLEPIYEHVEQWRSCFDYGMRDWVYQATDFTIGSNLTDDVLNDLAEMVVQLGGTTSEGQDRWRFCCILLPRDIALPLQQRGLIVRAQSKHSPHQIGVTTVSVSPNQHIDSLSLKAYQSGHIIYRPETSSRDILIARGGAEGDFRSNIAVPIAGEDGLSTAVMYIVSDEVNAFSLEDQRVLRMVGRMVGELLSSYQVRHYIPGKLTDIISTPEVVDRSFREFLSETEFLSDVEALLINMAHQELTEQESEEEVSFIAIDIDNQTSLAAKYGDQLARNLSRLVGLRIQGQLRLYDSLKASHLYHVYADRYYLMLKGMPLAEARNQAEFLRVALGGEYRVDARRGPIGRPILPERLLELSNVSVRLGVTSYKYWKLKEVLGRYRPEVAVSEVRKAITIALDGVLEKGQQEGGNVIISWDFDAWGYIKWPSSN